MMGRLMICSMVNAGMNHSIALVWVEALLQYTVDVGPDVVLHTLFMSAAKTLCLVEFEKTKIRHSFSPRSA